MAKTVKRMRFISFVLALDIDDADVKCFQRFCNSHQVGVMLSSNPRLHAMYLGHHLRSTQQLIGYIKCMTEYVDDPRTMLPAQLVSNEEAFLNALQAVASWYAHEKQDVVIAIKKAAKL